MFVTAEMLKSIGVKDIITFSDPVIMVNGRCAISATARYKTLEEMKHTDWFGMRLDGTCGSFIMLYEPNAEKYPKIKEDERFTSEDYFVCLYISDYDKWKEGLEQDEKEWSKLWVHRNIKKHAKVAA